MTESVETLPQLTVVHPEAAPAARSGWRKVRFALRWLATSVLIGWLAVSADWRAVGHTFATASIPWLLIAAGTYLASQLASVVRWEMLVRAAGFTQPLGRLFAAYFEGMFVNVCLPTTLGGDLLKVFRIGGAQQKRFASSTVAADRACGLVALVTLLGMGLLLKLGKAGNIAAPCLFAAVVAASLTASWAVRTGVIPLGGDEFAGKTRLLRMLRPVSRFLPIGIRQLAVQTSWPRVMVWAFVVQGLNVAAVAAAARSIGLTVSPIEILVATTTVSLAAALPISIAGIGIREASLPLVLAADGVPRALAIALGITWSGIVLAVGLLGGPVHFIEQRRAVRERKSVPPAPASRSPALCITEVIHETLDRYPDLQRRSTMLACSWRQSKLLSRGAVRLRVDSRGRWFYGRHSRGAGQASRSESEPSRGRASPQLRPNGRDERWHRIRQR